MKRSTLALLLFGWMGSLAIPASTSTGAPAPRRKPSQTTSPKHNSTSAKKAPARKGSTPTHRSKALPPRRNAPRKAPVNKHTRLLQKALKHLASARAGDTSKKSKAYPPKARRAWWALLHVLRTHMRDFSLAQLQRLRKLLEVESDRDRNAYPDFPPKLSMTLIRAIVHLDLRQGQLQLTRRRGNKPKRHKRKATQKASRRKLLKKAAGPALGDEGSLSDLLGTPNTKRTRKTKKGVRPIDLPPLVFTEKDLARFRTPARFLIWPMSASRLSSGFGWRYDPFTRRRRFHAGIDLRAPYGTSVRAAASGWVRKSGWLGSCGMGLLIQHAGGFSTLYCHLSQLLAPRKSYVQQGQRIGRTGSTGRSTAPHLHFSLLRGRKAVNPLKYLP